MNSIGNDLVDLTSTENLHKWRDAKFLKRVFDASEREAIAQAADPNALLWSIWAAKEAVYKAQSKIAHQPFAPNRISICPSAGEASWDGTRYRLAWENTADWTHCFTSRHWRVVKTWIERLENPISGYLTPAEAMELPASRQLRLLAKREICRLGYAYEQVQIKRTRRGAPVVYLGERPAKDLDLSFSHDGNYIAVALSAGS